MPNYCDYEMKIKGTKKNCEEWLSRMNDYEKENHFWRIFDADIAETNPFISFEFFFLPQYCEILLLNVCAASESKFESDTVPFALL